MEQNEQKDLVDLANAHVTQKVGSDQKKTPWSVEANISNVVLGELDPNYSEAQVFEILDFARTYELVALNSGIQFQKEISNKYWSEIEGKLKRVIAELTEENDRLATLLEKHIGEEV